MQKKRKKGLQEGLQNISTMLILMVFVVLCVIIAGVIGVYSVHKANRDHVSAANEGTGAGDIQPTVAAEQSAEENPQSVTTNNAGETVVSETIAHTGNETEDQRTEAENGTAEETESELLFQETSKGLTVTLYHAGGWGDETDPFLQYELVIQNTGSQDVSGWSVELSVSDQAVCNNIWNGVGAIEDGVLRVDAADFNSQLVAGSQTSVGIIIEQPGTVQFLDVSFE